MAMTLAITDDCDTLDLNRRRETRTDAARVLRAYEPFSGRATQAETVNVSTGGMCLRMHATVQLRPGRFLTLRSLSAAFRADVLAGGRSARVVWTRPDPTDTNAQLVGVQLYSAAVLAAA